MKTKIIKPPAYANTPAQRSDLLSMLDPAEGDTARHPWKNFFKTAIASLLVASILIGLGILVYRVWHERWVAINQANVQQLNGRLGSAPGGEGLASDENSNAAKEADKQSGGRSSASSSQTSKTYCGHQTMPQGVCQAIESVEASGVKNNSYVTADTSQIPHGTKIKVDRSSWQPESSSSGSIDFSASFKRLSFEGTAKLQLVGQVWKVTAYTIH